MPDTFDIGYPQNPLLTVDTKERTPFYYPELYRVYAENTIFGRFVTPMFNHNGPRATELVVTSPIMPHANHDPIGNRQMWLDASYMDTFARKITFKRYGGKMSLNRYDDMITYLTLDNVQGLRKLINEGLGHMMTRTMDKLARDAFMRAPYAYFGDGSATNFNGITETMLPTTSLLQEIQLGLQNRPNPLNTENPAYSNIFCITSPGVIHALRTEAATTAPNAFTEVYKYAQPGRIYTGEIGAMFGVRFIQTNEATLFNAGAKDTQATIAAVINPGDGAPDPTTDAVDSIEFVGQSAATHNIKVSTTTGFEVGDFVTIHKDVVSASDTWSGVTGGLDYRDGSATNRRIVAIDPGVSITVDRPIMEPFDVDLATGVYGYVTKALHVHSMVFVTGNDGVVMSSAQPPEIIVQDPVDDLRMQYRISWHAYMGYQSFNKNAFEVAYVAAPHRLTGKSYVGR